MTIDVERDFPGTGFWLGIVVKRDDPEGMYRIKARVPQQVDETDWAFPFGLYAGNKHGGGPFVPEIGDKVLLMWEGGDINHSVYYIPGIFHRGQVPSGHVIGTGSEVGQDNYVWQNSKLRIEVDTRDDTAGLRIAKLDETGDAVGDALAITFDTVSNQIEIATTLGLVLKSTGTVEIEGGTVIISDRPVSPGGEPI